MTANQVGWARLGEPSEGSRLRYAALGGCLAVALNVIAVIALADQPHAYKEGAFGPWMQEASEHPRATGLSAWAFTLGVLALVPFAWGVYGVLGRRSGLAAGGAVLIALAGVMNGAGTLTPFVLVQHVLPTCAEALEVCEPVATALLGITLSLDALFNALLGSGLLLVGWAAIVRARAAASERSWRPIGWLGVLAGLCALPITLQAHSAYFASFLLVAGPLWLLWVVLVSKRMATIARELDRAQATLRPVVREGGSELSDKRVAHGPR